MFSSGKKISQGVLNIFHTSIWSNYYKRVTCTWFDITEAEMALINYILTLLELLGSSLYEKET